MKVEIEGLGASDGRVMRQGSTKILYGMGSNPCLERLQIGESCYKLISSNAEKIHASTRFAWVCALSQSG